MSWKLVEWDRGRGSNEARYGRRLVIGQFYNKVWKVSLTRVASCFSEAALDIFPMLPTADLSRAV